MGVLVLLGHENDDFGELSRTAMERCQRAMEILKADPNVKVLPTGAYGDFNRTATPHGAYLIHYLVQQGIARERILPFTNSANTVDDALCARRIIEDLQEQQIMVVTSRFHMPRVRFIFERIFPERQIAFYEAPDGLHAPLIPKKQAEEASKLAHMRREWVDVPLYDPRQPFPTDVYANAHEEHKHYDNVSLAIITGMVAVFLLPYTTAQADLRSFFMFILSALIICCLTLMYELTAQTARTARRVMRNIEIGFGQYGFSAAYRRQSFAIRGHLSRLLNRIGRFIPSASAPSFEVGIRGIVIFLALTMIGAQMLAAVVVSIFAAS